MAGTVGLQVSWFLIWYFPRCSSPIWVLGSVLWLSCITLRTIPKPFKQNIHIVTCSRIFVFRSRRRSNCLFHDIALKSNPRKRLVIFIIAELQEWSWTQHILPLCYQRCNKFRQEHGFLTVIGISLWIPCAAEIFIHRGSAIRYPRSSIVYGLHCLRCSQKRQACSVEG